MPARLKRRCLDCPALTYASRCPNCERVRQRLKDQRRGGHGDWRARARAVEAHRYQVGDVCPGWGVPPHLVEPPNRLSADHPTSIAQGGPTRPDAYAVLCVACNSRKGAR